MKVSISDLLEHWYELVEYAKKALSLAEVYYLVTWCKIFPAPRGKGWSDVLLMIRLLFTVLVSNAKLEFNFLQIETEKQFPLAPWYQTFGKHFENYRKEQQLGNV